MNPIIREQKQAQPQYTAPKNVLTGKEKRRERRAKQRKSKK